MHKKGVGPRENGVIGLIDDAAGQASPRATRGRLTAMSDQEVSRRDFLAQLGVTVGAAAVAGAAGPLGVPSPAEAQQPAGKIPDPPFQGGPMTFLSRPPPPPPPPHSNPTAP